MVRLLTQSYRFQWGVSLVEVTVSLFLLSFILLGLVATQMIALREAKSAYYFSVAAQQLSNLAVMAQTDATIEEWNEQNQRLLPQGKGHVNGEHLAIYWGGEAEQTCKSNRVGQAGCLHLTAMASF